MSGALFREGMSKEELTTSLIISMDHFRPAVAEIARDAKRWQFCVDHRFPVRIENSRWSLTVKVPAIGGNYTFYGETATECVDTAIAAIEEKG